MADCQHEWAFKPDVGGLCNTCTKCGVQMVPRGLPVVAKSCRPDVDHAWSFIVMATTGEMWKRCDLCGVQEQVSDGAELQSLWYETAADEITALINRTPRSPTREEIIATLKGVV